MAESQISTLTKQKQYHKRRQQQKKMKKKFYGLTKTEIIDRHKLLVKSVDDGGYGLAVGHTVDGAANQGDMMKVLVEKKGMGYSDTILGNDQIELLSDDKFMMVEMIIDLPPGTVLTKGIKCFRLSTDDDQKTGSDGLRLEVNPRVKVGNKVMMKKLIAGEVGLKATANDLISFAETGYIAQDVLDGVQWMGFSREEKLDVLHVATCKVLCSFGYYKFDSIDEDGWPHFTELKAVKNLTENQQGLLMQEAILKYLA